MEGIRNRRKIRRVGERGEKSVLTLTMIFKYFVKMVLL